MVSKAQIRKLKSSFDASAIGGFAQDDYCFCAASNHLRNFRFGFHFAVQNIRNGKDDQAKQCVDQPVGRFHL